MPSERLLPGVMPWEGNAVMEALRRVSATDSAPAPAVPDWEYALVQTSNAPAVRSADAKAFFFTILIPVVPRDFSLSSFRQAFWLVPLGGLTAAGTVTDSHRVSLLIGRSSESGALGLCVQK
jgi:hypothetical protein